MAITARLMTYITSKRRHQGGELLMRTRAYKTGFTPLETMTTRIRRRVRWKFLTGFTLIEMVMVIAIIAILVSMVIHITRRISDQAKERLCRETITLLGNALEQFRDFGYEYKHADYAGLTFPLDCTDYDITASVPPCLNIQDTLHNALYSAVSTDPPLITIGGGTHDKTFSGSEALYFILSQIPDCRVILNKIDKSLLTNNSNDKPPGSLTINLTTGLNTITLPLTRIIDPWGTTLRYDYYPECIDYTGPMLYKDYRDSAKKTFPVITSAGADKQFDTADDITNVK
jgi:prepilin-type N-terminal cleavage/methylation domain-containing protein